MLQLELIPALLTPCQRPGSPDYASLQSLCAHIYKEGATGVFAVSSTGEMPLMSRKVRRKVLQTVREATPADKTLYAGTSGTGIEQVLKYTQDAADVGADVAVVMSPFFLKLDQPRCDHRLVKQTV